MAVLEYVADIKPEAGLAPEGRERARMRKWLGLINSELHTGALEPVLSPTNPAPTEACDYPLGRAGKALEHVDDALNGREWLTQNYSVADMYLAVVMTWLQSPKIENANKPVSLADHPNIEAHHRRVFARPAASRALGEELEMFRAPA